MNEQIDQKIVRSSVTGDKIYLLKENKRFWIRNPETLYALGFDFGQEVEITPKELYEYDDGGSVDMKESEETSEKEVVYTQAHKPTPILNYRRSA